MFAASASKAGGASLLSSKTSSSAPLLAGGRLPVAVARASRSSGTTNTECRTHAIAQGLWRTSGSVAVAVAVAGVDDAPEQRRRQQRPRRSVLARAADPSGAPAGQISAALMESMRAKIGAVRTF
jgi:hypothetical protein